MNCNDCGACCMEQGCPPGYAVVVLNPEAWPEWTGDHKQVEALQAEARTRLLDYLTNEQRCEPSGPCCWLNLKTKRCRFYFDRPQVCRAFEVGSLECLAWRNDYDIQRAKSTEGGDQCSESR